MGFRNDFMFLSLLFGYSLHFLEQALVLINFFLLLLVPLAHLFLQVLVQLDVLLSRKLLIINNILLGFLISLDTAANVVLV